MSSSSIFSSLGAISIGTVTLSAILKALFIFIVCYIVIRILMSIVTRAMKRSKLDEALKGFLLTAARIALWVLAVIMIAEALGFNTASLVAVVSIAGLALSLSIQNVMSNLFSGITLLITHPFGAGDFVDIGANQGTIKSVGLFYTVMDTVDNKVINIPNGDVTAASVVNYNKEPLRRVDMTFDASYDSATESVRWAIQEAASRDERILPEPAPVIVISQYKDSTIEYKVRLWCKNEDYWDVYFGMNEHVRECFEKYGVEMSYNHMNVHVVQ